MSLDRFKEALFALVRAGTPGIDYLTGYRARVVSQDAGTGKLDLQPDDPRLPSMSNIPLWLGIPGASAQIHVRDTPAFVEVRWQNGDPTRPYAALFEAGSTTIKLVISADQIVLGGEDGAELATAGETLQSYLDNLADLLANHTHGAVGGTTTVSPTLLNSPAPTGIKPPTLTVDRTKLS